MVACEWLSEMNICIENAFKELWSMGNIKLLKNVWKQEELGDECRRLLHRKKLIGM